MEDEIQESIDVAPSADNGNIPLETDEGNGIPPIAPKETPIEPVAPADPVAADPELFELPDGRKVDAVTLTKEWKENFLPEFTRKSQALAAKETVPNINNKPANPLSDPDFVPQTYAELAEAIRNSTLQEIEDRERAADEQRKGIENAVSQQLTEVKTLDPNLNETALFQHAMKYGFRDLKLAHQNMKDMSGIVKTVQKTTADNIAKRVDPVSVSPGATGARIDPSQFDTARDFLKAIQGK